MTRATLFTGPASWSGQSWRYVLNNTLTVVSGVEVGHWTSTEYRTGVTVMVFPEPNRAVVEVRGGAPGTRETALLEPGRTVEQIQALVFSGGSAFGLDAAQGVLEELHSEGKGHPTPAGPVPIVPAAVIFDLQDGVSFRPGSEQGAAAYRARSASPVPVGQVGAGRGATTSQWRGVVQPSGLGSAAMAVAGCVVAALAVVNPVGDVFSLYGEALTGGDPIPGGPVGKPVFGTNTTLVALATDAHLSRSELMRLAVRGGDGVAACIRPSHTRFDGDAVFAVSCGGKQGEVDGLAEVAFAVTGQAIAGAVAVLSEQES